MICLTTLEGAISYDNKLAITLCGLIQLMNTNVFVLFFLNNNFQITHDLNNCGFVSDVQ